METFYRPPVSMRLWLLVSLTPARSGFADLKPFIKQSNCSSSSLLWFSPYRFYLLIWVPQPRDIRRLHQQRLHLPPPFFSRGSGMQLDCCTELIFYCDQCMSPDNNSLWKVPPQVRETGRSPCLLAAEWNKRLNNKNARTIMLRSPNNWDHFHLCLWSFYEGQTLHCIDCNESSSCSHDQHVWNGTITQ